MSNETTKRLAPLLRKLRGRFAPQTHDAAEPDASGAEPLLCALVRALLEWNAGQSIAASAYTKLGACFVDLNEMRVCSHGEFMAALAGHPAAADRAARLRACLADVYRREHAMSLAVLREAPKREARQYLDSLDGVPRAVASRIAHEWLEIHAVPVDDRLRDLLADEGVIEEGTSAEHAAAELERAIPSSEAKDAITLLLAWAEADGRVREPDAERSHPSSPTPSPKLNKSSASASSKKAKQAAKDLASQLEDAHAPSGGANGGAKKTSKVAAKATAPARSGTKAKQGAKGASNARGRSAKK